MIGADLAAHPHPAEFRKKWGAALADRTPNFCLIHAARAGRLGPALPCDQLQPLVAPQVSHLRQVPFRTRVKLPHSVQLSPS